MSIPCGRIKEVRILPLELQTEKQYYADIILKNGNVIRVSKSELLPILRRCRSVKVNKLETW